jgi:hypothetical protein
MTGARAAAPPTPTPVARRQADSRLMLVLLLLAALVRLALVFANQGDANDDHLEAARAILDAGWAAPDRSVCWQCYHAKLYHYAWAAALRVTGADASLEPTQRLVGGLLSGAAGIVWLVVLFRWLSRARWAAPPVRTAGFALVAFCPEIVGIQVQATNDSFAILFGSLAVCFAMTALGDGERRVRASAALAAAVFVVLTASSKASGWVLFLALAAVLAVRVGAEIAQGRSAALTVRFLALLVGLFAVSVPTQQPYRGYIQRHGTPFKGALIEDADRPDAPLWRRTHFRRAGVRSLSEAFGTFPLPALVRLPYITGGNQPFPEHRTSFWAQLHGRMAFTRFAQWPRSWQSLDPLVMGIGRVGMVLALLPLAALLAGVVRWTGRLAGACRQQRLSRYLATTEDWVPGVVGLFLFAMLVKITVDHREFSAMKPIYALPAVMAYVFCFVDGLGTLVQRAGRWLLVLAWCLAGVFALDAAMLGHDLVARRTRAPAAAPAPPSPAELVRPRAGADHLLVAGDDGRCLSVAGAALQSKDNLMRRTCRNRPGQIWRFRQVGDGQFQIVTAGGRLAIAAPAELAGSGQVALLRHAAESEEQRWWLRRRPGSADEAVVTSVPTGAVLSVEGGSTAAGAFVLMRAGDDRPAQGWRMVPLEGGEGRPGAEADGGEP